MKPFSFSEYCTEWMQSFRALVPGGAHSELPREAQVAADQKWEDEGGSIMSEKK